MSTEIVPFASASMTSLEIAELVNSRHDKVKQSIERLVKQGVITQPPTGVKSYVDGSGRTVRTKMYVFSAATKRDTFIVVAQLSPKFTARLVDRWQELEAQVRQPAFVLPDFTNPVVAARAWADEVEQKLIAQEENAVLRPKAAALDRLTNTDGSFTITQAAKMLSLAPRAFFGELARRKWLYKRGVWMAYQDKIDNQWMHHILSEVVMLEGERATTQARITTKGLTQLAKLIEGACLVDLPRRTRRPPMPSVMHAPAYAD